MPAIRLSSSRMLRLVLHGHYAAIRPLYGPRSGGADGAGDFRWSKWSFWVLHATFFCAVYAAILVIPRTQWRVRTLRLSKCHQYVW